MKHLLHLASRIYNTPLLIDRAKLEIILGVLGPRIGWEDGGQDNQNQEAEEQRLRHKPYAVSPEGIGILDIQGTLVNRTSGLDALSGMRSYSSIQEELEDAYTDPAIKAILLRIDSHGGETAGAFDLADFIAKCGKQKKIWAVADDTALSAGYLLASQAERIYISRTGSVGSVGVLAIHVDQSAFDKQEGLKYTTIFAGSHKNDLSPHEPISKSGYAMIKAEVDRLNGIFVSAVAKGRNLTSDEVSSTEAQVYFGENAIPAHFADRVGTFSDALKDLTEAVAPAPVPVSTAPLTGGILGAKQGGTMPAIKRHKTETSDGSWDGPANKTRLRSGEDEAYYHKAYAWQDPDGDPATKEAYRFIHHEVSGDGDPGAANMTACSTGIGVLNGGRGGTTIPDGDKGGVHSHLAGHMEDGGKEAPPLKAEVEEVVEDEPTPTPEPQPDAGTKVPDPVLEPPAPTPVALTSPTPLTPPDPPPPSATTLIESARTTGEAKAYEHFEDVVRLCRAIGQPDSVALDFIRKKTPLAQVCLDLISIRASAADSNPIRSTILPESGTGTSGDPKNSPVVKEAERLRAEMLSSAARMKGR
jgi:signal peptide peptidase SppA